MDDALFDSYDPGDDPIIMFIPSQVEQLEVCAGKFDSTVVRCDGDNSACENVSLACFKVNEISIAHK